MTGGRRPRGFALAATRAFKIAFRGTIDSE